MSDGPTPETPRPPTDAEGRFLRVGDIVVVGSVASCVTGLPEEDRRRLFGLVGQRRQLVRCDTYGFAWLCFDPDALRDDFCLRPSELRRQAEAR